MSIGHWSRAKSLPLAQVALAAASGAALLVALGGGEHAIQSRHQQDAIDEKQRLRLEESAAVPLRITSSWPVGLIRESCCCGHPAP